jgi:hypothetical protein
MITFATFYIDPSQDASEYISQNNILLDDRNKYFQMIDMLFRSASLFHPDCKKVILTDCKTDLSQVASDVAIYRTSINPQEVMLGRLISQLDYIRKEDWCSDLLFLDSDILVNANLDVIFNHDFNVGLTYRIDHEMPINGGVIFISKRNKPLAIEFFDRVLQIYQEKYMTYNKWWGDQYSLLEAVRLENLTSNISESSSLRFITINGVEILLLPCEVYNFSPENTFFSIAKELKSKGVIHFKGHRKRLIDIYWITYLAHREHSSVNTIFKSFISKTHIMNNAFIEILNQFSVLSLLQKTKRSLMKYISN